jgi:hypothetical protein
MVHITVAFPSQVELVEPKVKPVDSHNRSVFQSQVELAEPKWNQQMTTCPFQFQFVKPEFGIGTSSRTRG